MNSNFDIVTQTQVGEWEKFQVVLVEHPLKQFIGQTIGLYNIDWFRFLRMRGSGAGEVDGSPESRTREVMPKDWYDCKFTVVDAGNNKAQPPMVPHGSPSMAMPMLMGDGQHQILSSRKLACADDCLDGYDML